jgi:hypothetical protein
MLPTVGNDTLKIIWYAAEVAGRTLGVAAMPNLVSDPTRRAALEKSGNVIAAAAQAMAGTYTARILFELIDQRIAMGKGRGVDRGFDAAVSSISETVRTSLPDRRTNNPDYLDIFPNGAEEFSSPTIKEDELLGTNLRQAVAESKLAVKAEVLGVLDAILPIVGPTAKGVRDTEQQRNTLFQSELSGRKQVIDTLWEERKTVETALGRGGRGLARFIFFDFRNQGGQDTAEEPPPAGPNDPKDPEK